MRRTLILILALGLAGCSGSATSGLEGERLPITSFVLHDLQSALRQDGFAPSVSPRTFNAALPGADEYRICIDGTQIRAYEYPSERERASVSESIDTTGSPIGHAFVEWIGKPRFYARGRLLVMSLNEANATNQLLTRTIGPTLTSNAEGGRGSADVDTCDRSGAQ